jgi:hypothetical protein
MPRYEVVVPFHALQYEGIGWSTSADLPESFSLGSIAVSQEAPGAYTARLDVVADNVTTAKVAAVSRVRQILTLFAVAGDGFRVSVGSGLEATRRPDTDPPIPRDLDTGGLAIDVASTVELEGAVALRKMRGNVEPEAVATAWRDAWPEWLSTALELNYLATISQESRPAFVVEFAALEVLVDAVEGDPISVFGTKVPDKRQRRNLLEAIRALLAEHGMEAFEIERVVARVSDAQIVGTVDRIASALRKLGQEATEGDVRRVVRARGAIVHPSPGINESDFESALGLTKRWVQGALRKVLGREVEAEPGAGRSGCDGERELRIERGAGRKRPIGVWTLLVGGIGLSVYLVGRALRT